MINNDVLEIIFSFNIQNNHIILKNINYIINFMKNITILNKYWYQKYKDLFKKYIIIYKLLKKYYKLQNDYESDIEYYKYTPILYDALTTSLILPYTNGTFSFIENYDEYLNDLNNIIKFVPSSINYNMGYLRCRNNVTPLYLACVNHFIPIEIVKKIYNLSNNFTIYLNGEKIDIISDLNINLNSGRLRKIKKIFTK